MKQNNELFDLLDAWRHFPSYQLERRVDIFFALYLPEVLENKLGYPILQKLVPEFPVQKKAIYPKIMNNRSFKIDYLALSASNDKAVFVELKTENLSRRSKQDDYLQAAKNVGLRRLLEGLLDIFRATKSKRKYFCLLLHLENMGMLRIPNSLKDIMKQPNLQGSNNVSKQIEITVAPTETLIVYVQPSGKGRNVISFQEFAEVVRKKNDPISQRFANSLSEWAEVQAGNN